MNQDELRQKLNIIVERGLSAKSIAINSGIGEISMSRFRKGTHNLKNSEAQILSDYLDQVVIPKRNWKMLHPFIGLQSLQYTWDTAFGPENGIPAGSSGRLQRLRSVCLQ